MPGSAKQAETFLRAPDVDRSMARTRRSPNESRCSSGEEFGGCDPRSNRGYKDDPRRLAKFAPDSVCLKLLWYSNPLKTIFATASGQNRRLDPSCLPNLGSTRTE